VKTHWVILSTVLAPLSAYAQQSASLEIVRPSAFAVSPPMHTLAPVVEAPTDSKPDMFFHAGSNFTLLLNFAGTPAGSFLYPDSNGAPGARQYMQWTNARYAIYSKATGKTILGPLPAKNFWASLLGTPGATCATTNAGDGIINYDKAAQRWVVTHHTTGALPLLQCVAVSTTSDATGSYYQYAFELTQNYYPDYPQLAVWPDAYYVSTNLLNPNGFTNVDAQVCALDRTNMLIGNPGATAQCRQTSTNWAFSVLQPSDWDGATAPPTGAPNYLMGLDTNAIDLYKFHVDWVRPTNTSLVLAAVLPVKSFSEACGGGNCIPQLGSSNLLNSVGDRLLHRLAYRNFGTYDTMVVTHAITAGSSIGVRWYEIRNPGTAPRIYQWGTFAPNFSHRWLSSAAMDQKGNIALGYSISSAKMYPGINITGRLSTDPLGAMGSEISIVAGGGADTATGNDWGNASSMSIDPADDCTFWYTNEYLTNTGTLWVTRIASFRFSSCP
jgi:hypothetical protein